MLEGGCEGRWWLGHRQNTGSVALLMFVLLRVPDGGRGFDAPLAWVLTVSSQSACLPHPASHRVLGLCFPVLFRARTL
jgi:hypothetical protein